MVRGGVGQKHVKIVLGWSHNSFDEQTTKTFFFKFWHYEGGGGSRGDPKGSKHVTIDLERPHNSAPACNWFNNYF